MECSVVFPILFLCCFLVLHSNAYEMDKQPLENLASYSRSKRSYNMDDVCQSQQQTFLEEAFENTANFNNFFSFPNETKFSIALAWAGEDSGKIIVTVTEEESFFFQPVTQPTVYLSTDNGHSFNDITGRVSSAAVKKANGLQKSPVNSLYIYIVAAGSDETTTDLYITKDGGDSFTKTTLNFDLDGPIIFHPSNTKYMMTLAGPNSLYVSSDEGTTWSEKKRGVKTAKWGVPPNDHDQTIYVSYYPGVQDQNALYIAMMNNDKTKMEKSVDLGSAWTHLLDNVYEFGVEGKFLFASIMTGYDGSDRQVNVSTDGGKTWNHAMLPTLGEDRFFSVLDMSEDLVFMHVDSPGDTGFGTLYTSNANGIIYSESLEQHLYPNYMADVTDFYKVESMRGVYLASQLKEDQSVHTMISFDRGGNWQPVRRPQGAACQHEDEECFLQIHNAFSKKMGIQAQGPLSVSNAKGIIMVHGHVASALQTTPPDVFVSSDGGYTWIQALEGPHHYQIADHGGLLVAIPSDTDKPNTIKFSTDEGRCWHTFRFTDEQIYFTGLLTEPGSRSMSVSIWGFGEADHVWRVHTLDFTQLITRPCNPQTDYEEWLAHGESSSDAQYAGCILGVKETFKRLKKDSWCANGHEYEVKKDEATCPCSRDDYQCDYGYHRPAGQEQCVEDPEFRGGYIDICMRGHIEQIVTLGYRKIPGDKCEGGFSPQGDKLVDLHKTCTDSIDLLETQLTEKYVNNYYHLDKDTKGGSNGGVIAVILIALFSFVGFVVILFFVQKYKLLGKTSVSYKYSMLSSQPDDIEAITTTANIYDDDSDDEVVVKPTEPRGQLNEAIKKNFDDELLKPKKSKGVKSYHDDSDDDMLNI